MSKSWGNSWSDAWGVSWGQTIIPPVPPTPVQQSGGSGGGGMYIPHDYTDAKKKQAKTRESSPLSFSRNDNMTIILASWLMLED